VLGALVTWETVRYAEVRADLAASRV
jgi:hypothetical protein